MRLGCQSRFSKHIVPFAATISINGAQHHYCWWTTYACKTCCRKQLIRTLAIEPNLDRGERLGVTTVRFLQLPSHCLLQHLNLEAYPALQSRRSRYFFESFERVRTFLIYRFLTIVHRTLISASMIVKQVRSRIFAGMAETSKPGPDNRSMILPCIIL